MEAIANHTAVGDRSRQRERLRDRRLCPVERRIEARDLRQVGHPREQRLDRREIVRLVQRRERHVLLQCRDATRVDAHRFHVLAAAMHDAVPDRHQPMMRNAPAQKPDKVFERAVVAERFAGRPLLLVEHVAVAILRDEARRRVDAFGLPSRDENGVLALVGEERELDARRACVQDGDRVGHGGHYSG